MPKMIYICILLIYFKVISKKRGSLLPPLTLVVPSSYFTFLNFEKNIRINIFITIQYLKHFNLIP